VSALGTLKGAVLDLLKGLWLASMWCEYDVADSLESM
jgi:hypothetical protein